MLPNRVILQGQAYRRRKTQESCSVAERGTIIARLPLHEQHAHEVTCRGLVGELAAAQKPADRIRFRNRIWQCLRVELEYRYYPETVHARYPALGFGGLTYESINDAALHLRDLFKQRFGFTANDAIRVFRAMFPNNENENVVVEHARRVPKEVLFLMLLHRFVQGESCASSATVFNVQEQDIAHLTNALEFELYNAFRHLVDLNCHALRHWKSKFRGYAALIAHKYRDLTNKHLPDELRNVFGFIDGTNLSVKRPGVGRKHDLHGVGADVQAPFYSRKVGLFPIPCPTWILSYLSKTWRNA